MPDPSESAEYRLNGPRTCPLGSCPLSILIAKLRWYDMGNRVSDRQWNDIVGVLEVRGDELDLDYVRNWARCFGVEELLNEALGEV